MATGNSYTTAKLLTAARDMNSQPITRLRRKMLLLANMLAGNVDPDRVVRISRLLRSTLGKISDLQNA
jgi:hypothetical protein